MMILPPLLLLLCSVVAPTPHPVPYHASIYSYPHPHKIDRRSPTLLDCRGHPYPIHHRVGRRSISPNPIYHTYTFTDPTPHKIAKS